MQHALMATSGKARRLLSTGAAAGVASCHRTTILRAIERGELPAVRLGRNGDYRIRPEALQAWLAPAGRDRDEEAK